jgi:hypothetical protein
VSDNIKGELGILLRRRGRGEVGFTLGDDRLVGSAFDLEQNLPLFYITAFLKITRLQKSFDARPQIDGIDRFGPADITEMGSNVFADDFSDHHAGWWRIVLGNGLERQRRCQ